MKTYLTIYGTDYGFCRGLKGSFKDKFNRVVKLASMFEQLSDKFDGMIERGNYQTDNARLALACKLMLYTGIRIGNEGSAEGYMTKPHPNSKEEAQWVQTYGLTTMLPDHVSVKRQKVQFMFLGKRHVDNYFEVTGQLAKQMKMYLRMYEGETLFDITAYELTKFIKKSIGRQFTPKDLRTLRANMLAFDKLMEITNRDLPTTKSEYNAEVKEIATYVSEHLNNTPGVCKKNYIDSMLFDEFAEMRPVTKISRK